MSSIKNFYFLIIFNMIFYNCDDSTSVIEMAESENPPLTKQDSLQLKADSTSLAQSRLRDSLRNEEWYNFDTFGWVTNDFGGYGNYKYYILSPPNSDSSSWNDAPWYPKAVAYTYKTEEFTIFVGHHCFTDAAITPCFDPISKSQLLENDDRLILDGIDTIGLYQQKNIIQNQKAIILYLPDPKDHSTFQPTYYIGYGENGEKSAVIIAKSAHKIE